MVYNLKLQHGPNRRSTTKTVQDSDTIFQSSSTVDIHLANIVLLENYIGFYGIIIGSNVILFVLFHAFAKNGGWNIHALKGM